MSIYCKLIGHQFVKKDNECKEECKRCHQIRPIEHEWDGYKCTCCGSVQYSNHVAANRATNEITPIIQTNTETKKDEKYYAEKLIDVFKDFKTDQVHDIMNNRENSKNKAIKQIGKNISDEFGFNGMQTTYRIFISKIPSGSAGNEASIVNYLWGGIGGWMH